MPLRGRLDVTKPVAAMPGKTNQALTVWLVCCDFRVLQLCPNSAEAGQALSDIYRALGRWDDNLTLLTSLQAQGWASLRLGLHHLATDSPHKVLVAIE